MNKQVEQIKTEIERRIREDYNGDEHEDEIAQCVCASMLYYINFLEEEPVSKDLEQAAIRIADEILPIAGREIWYGETEENIERRKQIREGVKRGANWQKEQMMKTAFDAEVGYWNIRGLSFNVRLKGDIKDGDRVKLIMIKEE